MTTQINYANAHLPLRAAVAGLTGSGAAMPTRVFKNRIKRGPYNMRVKLYGGMQQLVASQSRREQLSARVVKAFDGINFQLKFNPVRGPVKSSVILYLHLPEEALAVSKRAPKSEQATAIAKAARGPKTVKAVAEVDNKLQELADATIPSGAFDGLPTVQVNQKTRVVSIAGVGSATYSYGARSHLRHRKQYKVVGGKLQRTEATEVNSVCASVGLSYSSVLTPKKAVALAKAFAAAAGRSTKVVWATKAEVAKWVKAERRLRENTAKLVQREAHQRVSYTERKLKSAQTELTRANKAHGKAVAARAKIDAALS